MLSLKNKRNCGQKCCKLRQVLFHIFTAVIFNSMGTHCTAKEVVATCIIPLLYSKIPFIRKRKKKCIGRESKILGACQTFNNYFIPYLFLN